VIPFGAGAEIASLFGLPLLTSLFIGLALAITAIPVSAIVLMEFGLLKSKLGTTVITAGIIDDVLSLVVLAIIIQLAANGVEGVDYSEIGFSVVKIGAFIGGIFLLDFIIKKIKHRRPIKFLSQPNILKSKEIGFGLLLISAFAISLIAENIGLHFVIGAFFAGLIIYDQIIGKKNFEKVNRVFTAITFGLFSPIFFAFIGIHFQIQSLFDSWWFFIVLLAAAIGGKVAGGFIGARIAGFSNSESLTIGNLVNSRGMVELVIASIGLELGIIDITLFAVIVGVGFITTIMSPVLARITISHSSEEQSKEKPTEK
jgi:Kef-type K+ transport system membrane component KefB